MKNLLTLAFGLLLTASAFAQDSDVVNAKFLAMLNGTEEAAQLAIDTYGSDEVKENGMIPFGANPKLTHEQDNCVFFTLEDDGELNEYYICSESGKITEFDWYYDDEDE